MCCLQCLLKDYTHTHTHKLHKKAVLKKVRERGKIETAGRGGGEREGKCAAFCQIAKASRELEYLHCARVERNICWSAGGH